MMTFYDIVKIKFFLIFFLKVTELPNDTSESTLQIFWKLVDEYVTSGRIHGLNLSGKIRKFFFDKIKIQNRNDNWILNETPRQLLQGPLDNVLFDFQGDVFSRFVMSKVCHKVMMNFIDDQEVIQKTV